MATKKAEISNSGLVLVTTYLALFITNGFVIFLANLLFSAWVVLGTMTISIGWAIIHSAGVLALINTFVIPFVREYENRRGKMLTSMEWMAVYLVVNTVGIWVIARFPDQFGLGIVSWMVAVALGIVLDLVQGAVMMQIEKLRTKTS